jgi:ketosteroid isomerase-like protein
MRPSGGEEPSAAGLRDTERAMPEESTTPDLVEIVRGSVEAEGIDAALRFYAPDAVWDASPWGMGVFEGQAAVRGFFEDWSGAYADIQWEAEEIRDLGSGLTFAVILQTGRGVGSSGSVQLRYAAVAEWSDGLIVRNTTCNDIDEARAAAERLAEARG